jgi:hypothetical protein
MILPNIISPSKRQHLEKALAAVDEEPNSTRVQQDIKIEKRNNSSYYLNYGKKLDL